MNSPVEVEIVVGPSCALSKQKKKATPTPQQKKVQQKGKENCNPNAEKGNSKPSMAQIYQEGLNLKNDYRKGLMLVWDKWKTGELKDRREAQADAHLDNNISYDRQRKHKLEMYKKTEIQGAKRAKVEHEYHLAKLKEEWKTQLMIELCRTNKSKDEMKELIDLV
ncbi:unnamed protein product [Calypogeia fissa]